MTRLEKCILFEQKGFTYNKITGEIFGISGKLITRRAGGYINLSIYLNGKIYQLYGHHFAFFVVHRKTVPFIDHKNRDRCDNRIKNLRSVTQQQNAFNMKNVKGCTQDKNTLRWYANIMINYKQIYLGAFDSQELAHKAYLEAKKKYHVI